MKGESHIVEDICCTALLDQGKFAFISCHASCYKNFTLHRKTSFIMALAGKLKYNICVLNLSERGLTDDRLAVALSAVPPQVLCSPFCSLLKSKSQTFLAFFSVHSAPGRC